MKILVVAKPGSKKEGIKKIGKDILTGYDIYEVKVVEKPVKGKANQAIIEALAEFFKVRKSNIILQKGGTSKYKLFEIKN